jgi:hypothetical protein
MSASEIVNKVWNYTTGLREIAARVSSNISRGAYAGRIEIDDTERPSRFVLSPIGMDIYE